MIIILSGLIKKEIKEYFVKKGMEVITTMPFCDEKNSVLLHPDIQCFYDGDKFFTSKNLYDFFKNKVDNITVCERNLLTEYPNDVLFNVFVAGEYAILNKKTVATELLKYLETKYKIIDVKQGYANCSCLYLGNNTVATGDMGIKKALENQGFKVLEVDNTKIKLSGYKHGFIGGCCVRTKDELVFFGSLDDYFSSLKKYLQDNNIKFKEFCDICLEDFGSGIILS